MTEVEGGLDEPTELEPEQGSLDLASPEDDARTRGLGEGRGRGAAQGRRLSDDDPDAAVWAQARPGPRWTGSVVTTARAPPTCSTGLATAGRPTRGDRLGHPRRTSTIADAKPTNEAALVDLEQRRHLAVARGRRRRLDCRPAAVLDGVLLDLAPVVLDAPADPLGGRPGASSRSPATARPRRRHQPRRRPDRCDAARGLDKHGRRGSTSSRRRLPELARDAGTLGVVVDATAVHDLGASDVAGARLHAWPRARRTCGSSPTAGIAVDDAAGLIEFRLRRHRRAVPDHRQAARRPPAVGPRAASSAMRRRPPRAAPARRHRRAR